MAMGEEVVSSATSLFPDARQLAFHAPAGFHTVGGNMMSMPTYNFFTPQGLPAAIGLGSPLPGLGTREEQQGLSSPPMRHAEPTSDRAVASPPIPVKHLGDGITMVCPFAA
jgi:hypothetical protein